MKTIIAEFRSESFVVRNGWSTALPSSRQICPFFFFFLSFFLFRLIYFHLTDITVIAYLTYWNSTSSKFSIINDLKWQKIKSSGGPIGIPQPPPTVNTPVNCFAVVRQIHLLNALKIVFWLRVFVFTLVTFAACI